MYYLMPFSWKRSKERAKIHYFARMKSLARNNPDFKVRHPELVKELLNDSIKVKVESQKFLDRKFEKVFKYGETPKPSVIIKRLNRNV